ncbi:MAG: hypothetical protein Q4F29_10675 [Lachnospiraceae bacterium]|nr:hypothetical protein [Lachnospiraceae bacterium]
MKRILAILLSMMMLAASLSGCSRKDPREIYDEAVKKNAELTELEASTVTDMKISQGEEIMNMKTTMDMKMKGVNTEQLTYTAEGTTEVLGQTMDMSMYYADGYYYMETMGQKIKYPMDLQQMIQQIQQSTGGMAADSSYLSEIEAEKDGDSRILKYTLDGEKMDAYMQDVLKSVNMPGLEEAGISYQFQSASGESVVNKEGYYTSTKMKLVMDMTAQGETIRLDMDSDIVYHNPGQAVEITVPDLEGYTEIDPAAMGLQ